MTASQLIQKTILPSVLLMAVDDRILKYKHALPERRTFGAFWDGESLARASGGW